MARRQEKRVRRLKKNHAWIAFIIYFILIAIAGAVVFFLATEFTYYIVQSKLSAEYSTIEYMAKIYDSENGDPEESYALLQEEGRDFLIMDTEGNVLYVHGENTCSKESGKVLLSTASDWVELHMDTVNGYIYADERGIIIDEKGIFSMLRQFKADNPYAFSEVENDEGEFLDESGLLEIGKELRLRIPVWMAAPIKDGTEKLVAKAYFEINLTDLSLFGVAVAMLAVLAFLLIIIMLVSAINSIVSQRRMLKLFFTDMVVAGHNWMWFLFKGEHFLRKRSSAKNTYAVINMVFVKYRNYCVCHSIAEGERMLKKVYEHINRRLEKKEMCAHVSNSNFALLLQYTDQDQLKMRLQSLILELEKIDKDHVFSFQVGVDPIDVYKNDKGRIVRRKDIDLELEYNNACTARATLAENDESGVAFFDEKLVEDQRWIDRVTERQRYALEHEEFVVYYQPKYDPSTDKLRGAEALIRWQSPEFGFVPPGRFIPIFEKNGFITEIDHYMIEHVAKDQKAWYDQGFSCVPISVNVSRAHFIESDLAEQIRDMVDAAGTPHELIELELTESAFFDDKKALITTIMKLKEYGFSVSMDDFGSGYSSLNSLKDMPLDVLKLDAEFFRGDAHGNRGEIVVSEAIKLAKSLNMRTVAEGVEVKEQVDFLAEQGCDMIQGYYYAKPMPREDYEKRMTE